MHQQIHTHSVSPRLGSWTSILVFISQTPSFWEEKLPGLTVSSWARRLVSEHRGRTMIWHERLPCHLTRGHTERQLPPETGASVPVACWDRRRVLLCTHILYTFPSHIHMLTHGTLRQDAKSNLVCTHTTDINHRQIAHRERGITNARDDSISGMNGQIKERCVIKESKKPEQQKKNKSNCMHSLHERLLPLIISNSFLVVELFTKSLLCGYSWYALVIVQFF